MLSKQGNEKVREGTTWKISPARMFSFNFSTFLQNCSSLISTDTICESLKFESISFN